MALFSPVDRKKIASWTALCSQMNQESKEIAQSALGSEPAACRDATRGSFSWLAADPRLGPQWKGDGNEAPCSLGP
jgi:hypothetical protein